MSNKRSDGWGGSFENRTRLLVEVTQKVRDVLPASKGVWVRLSCSDWIDDEPSWAIKDTCRLLPALKKAGADLIDCSSAAISNKQKITTAMQPGYQLPFARAAKQCKIDGLMIGAVGRMDDPEVCEKALQDSDCDVVFNARVFLKHPEWVENASEALSPHTRLPSLPQFWRSATIKPADPSVIPRIG